MTLRACSTSSVSLVAVLDELEKISEDLPTKERVKRWLKNTAIITAASGVGAAAMTLGEDVLKRKLGPTWATLSPSTKRYIIGPALGVSSLGAGIMAKKMYDEQKRRATEPMPKG